MTQTENAPTLSEDLIDDLLFYARHGETGELQEVMKSCKASMACSDAVILLAAKDVYTGNTALHMACGNGHLGTTKAILSYIPAPCSPNSEPHPLISHKNACGNTALHWACLNGHLTVAQTLILIANADPSLTNCAGHDSIYEAELNGKSQVVEWILGQCDHIEGIGGESSAKDELVDTKSEDSENVVGGKLKSDETLAVHVLTGVRNLEI